MLVFLIVRSDQEKAIKKSFALFAALRFNTKKQVNWPIEIISKELAEPFSSVLIVLQSSIINQQSKYPATSIQFFYNPHRATGIQQRGSLSTLELGIYDS